MIFKQRGEKKKMTTPEKFKYFQNYLYISKEARRKAE